MLTRYIKVFQNQWTIQEIMPKKLKLEPRVQGGCDKWNNGTRLPAQNILLFYTARETQQCTFLYSCALVSKTGHTIMASRHNNGTAQKVDQKKFKAEVYSTKHINKKQF